jgi:putative membrane protein (TIGR04086 family)
MPEDRWQQTTLGRAFVGLMLAQGMYYGLWQFCAFLVVAFGNINLNNDWAHSPPEGWVWVLLQLIQLASVVLGGMVAGAGAGPRRGLFIGLLLGLVNGVIFLVVQAAVQQPLEPPALYGQAGFQAACGAVGGLLGGLVWRPITPILGPSGATLLPRTDLASLPVFRRLLTPFRGPVAWIRVFIGIIVAVGGSMWAEWILRYMLTHWGKELSVPSQLHARFVTWEISVLILLAGAAVSGSNTRYGFKHGLLVGLVTFGVLISFHLSEGREGREGLFYEVPQTILFTLFLGIDLKDQFTEPWPAIILSFCSVLPVAILGGWFGAELLPPLLRLPRRRRKILYPTGP